MCQYETSGSRSYEQPCDSFFGEDGGTCYGCGWSQGEHAAVHIRLSSGTGQ